MHMTIWPLTYPEGMTQIWFFWLSGNVFSWGCCFIWHQGLLWKDILSFPKVIIIKCHRFEKKHEFSIENYQFGFFVIVLFCLQYLIICIVRIIIEWTVICRFFDRFIPQLTSKVNIDFSAGWLSQKSRNSHISSWFYRYYMQYALSRTFF